MTYRRRGYGATARRLILLTSDRTRRIGWGDLTMAALIGFVAAPLFLFLAGALAGWAAPGHPLARATAAAAALMPLIAPVAVLAAGPGILIAGGLTRIGLIGPLPVIAAGAVCGVLPGLVEPGTIPVLSAIGAFYAGLSWIALRILRADIFVDRRENECSD